MYMAVIRGWNQVVAFSEDVEKAKKLAVKEKKKYCKDDLEKWTWERCSEYYGTIVEEIKDGLVIHDF